MHPDLEAIVSADEEGRARVGVAEERSHARIAAVQTECNAALAARRAASVTALQAEINAITGEAERRAADERRRTQEYLQVLAAAGETAFEDAVEQYTRMVLRS